MPLYSIHIHLFPEVLPHLFCRAIFKVVVALVFTVMLQISTCGGRKVGAHGKDKVLPQPHGSILSGGTVGGPSCTVQKNFTVSDTFTFSSHLATFNERKIVCAETRNRGELTIILESTHVLYLEETRIINLRCTTSVSHKKTGLA